MSNRSHIITLTLLALLCGAAPTLAADGQTLSGQIFSALERQTILDYYRGRYGDERETRPRSGGKQKGKHAKGKKHKGLPPGLAKRGRLPPGLEKQLERNGTLPPGLARRTLPEGLEGMLPRPASGLERVLVDNDVLLIEQASGLIVDVLRDVFNP
ncbi:MAG: RcnB family protein [gamma proteobacterium symbiont of Phacoides pectinatus]